MSNNRELADLISQAGGTSESVLAGRRNLIINGDFRVAQRGTTFTQTNNAYHLDRWLLQNTRDRNQQITQATDTPSNQGFKNSIKWEVYGSTKTGNSEIRQKVEDTEVANGRDVTLSFWAKATTANKHYVGIGDNVNATTVTITNTEWTKYTVTKTAVNSSSVLDVIIYAVGQGEAVGSSLWITGVQLELGSVATPFEHRSYGEELALCQRYFETSFPTGVTPSAANVTDRAEVGSIGQGNYTRNNQMLFKVRKRAVPTVTVYGNGTTGQIWRYRWDNAYQGWVSSYSLTPSEVGIRAYTYEMGLHSICYAYTADAEL